MHRSSSPSAIRNQKSTRPPIAILHAPGTNRDAEAALACELAGGAPEIVHIAQLRNGERRLRDYRMLILPGGFTYGDALGAGRLLALDLQVWLAEELMAFVESGKPVLGICNGFQALVKAGLLSISDFGFRTSDRNRSSLESAVEVTLTHNSSGRFECRWAHLRADPRSPCVFTQELEGLIYCPVAHGEGRFAVRDTAVLNALQARGQIALTYVHPDGRPANGVYPANPNGSVADIAGICNPQGNVLGLMPHPEDHVLWFQHPRWTRGEHGGLGLRLFENGIRYAAEVCG